jgi:hypothetical protein
LIRRLDEGLRPGCKLILLATPAGFGKTTLISEWLSQCGQWVAWLSLDEGDNDPVRFMAYFIAALQMIEANLGAGLLTALPLFPIHLSKSLVTYEAVFQRTSGSEKGEGDERGGSSIPVAGSLRDQGERTPR